MTSTAESTSVTEPAATRPAISQSETPAAEIERRLADQAPLWPIAHAAGLQNLRAIWDDSAIKRKMDRAAQAKALGVPESLENGNEEMPGDINVRGDDNHQEIHHHYPPAQPAQVQQPQIPPVTNMVVAAERKLWPTLLAVALSGVAGAAGPLIYQWLHQPQPQPTVQLPDYQLDLKVTDKP